LHVIINGFAVIFLQGPKETDIKGLKEMGHMGGKTEEFDIIIANGTKNSRVMVSGSCPE